MIKFLLQRPIAVFMTFLACFIVGSVTTSNIPISLLPDIAIPQITVQIAGENRSARELENTVVRSVRQQLMQVGKLRNIESETRDESAIIRLDFDYGTNTDLAFIEVNEKIDAAMNYIPQGIERPRVIKANATDIPVFYLNLTLKSDSLYGASDTTRYLGLSRFAESIIRRRIEQLPEVAMVDMTGTLNEQLRIVPNLSRIQSLGITVEDIENTLSANNVEPGSMVVKEGYYEYNIKFSSLLRTAEDVRNIFLQKEGRIFQLGELSDIQLVPQPQVGYALSGGKQSVTLAIIKQSEENMDQLKRSVQEVMDYFIYLYPDIEFSISRNQTELLDYTIDNLKQNLWLGFILICFVAVLFLGDVKSPFIIALSMVVSMVISMLFFYLFKITFNIISLSGLILALGMMIDNAIVVTENITQYRDRGFPLQEACNKGTSEVITPMLSSAFTTVAVFVPLIFLSGIAGAIFLDQALAVTIGLAVSYMTGILLLPVLYQSFYGAKMPAWRIFRIKMHNPIKAHTLDRFYDGGINWVFRHKTETVLFVAISLPLCYLLFRLIPVERMPQIEQSELLVGIEWNESIHLDENRQRVCALFKAADSLSLIHSGYVGLQQFLLNRESGLSSSESDLYFKAKDSKIIAPLQQLLQRWVWEHYPQAVISFRPPETIFEKLFVTGEPDIQAELYTLNANRSFSIDSLLALNASLQKTLSTAPTEIPMEQQLNLSIDREKLNLYGVSYSSILNLLKTAFKEDEIGTLRSYQLYIPITLAGRDESIQSLLQETLVERNQEEVLSYIPLQEFVSITSGEDVKTISAGRNGEFIPLRFYHVDDPEELIDEIKTEVRKEPAWEVGFSGSFFSNKKMMGELIVILFISLLLMYFIMAAQFESFLQPLIVLLEIPIDTAFALLLLLLCGHTLNLMSAIGIVVTCGIVINDSILKLDAINELRKEGTNLFEAIHEAGRRRLRPIIMTSLTTILAMVPMLFTSDMGSELQKPLAIAMIGAMVIGTLVSLFVIPLIYWFAYHKVKTASSTAL